MTIWDDSAPLPWANEPEKREPVEEAPPPPAPGPMAEAPGWSREQQMRLENEWRRLQRSFAYHPHVRVTPLEGDPPDQYQVEYRLRTVVIDEAGTLEYATTASVHVWLPPEFPHEPPLVRPISGLFHPNVVSEGINIDRFWTRTTSTLVEVVSGVGRLIAFQDYDLEGAWNAVAGEWVAANPRVLPTDPDADLSPEAGGDPLARICRHGPRTMEQIRGQLKQMGDALMAAEGAPEEGETAGFAQKMRQALGLFLEEDIPDELRVPVGELDDFARELPGSLGTWAAIREHRGAASAALGVMQQLRDAERSLEHELSAIDALSEEEPAGDAAAALRQLPALSRMELLHGNLQNLIGRSEQVVGEAMGVGQRLAKLPAAGMGGTSGLLQKRLEAEISRAGSLVKDGKEKLESALSALGPILSGAQVREGALRRMIDWRAYADLMEKAQGMAREVMDWGAAGLQAFFIRNESGQFGPFELEQKLTIGGRSVVVRNPASTQVEVISPDSGKVLGSGDGGEAVIPIEEPESGVAYETTFALTANCEEMAVQLDYIVRESDRILQAAQGAQETAAAPAAWLGRFGAALGRAEGLSGIAAEHQRVRREWVTLRDDLRTLRPFKERLATFRLLQRTRELAAKVAQRMQASKQNLADAQQRIAGIVAGSNSDLETGRLMIPQKWAKVYAEQVHRQETAQAEIRRMIQRLAEAGEVVRRRVADAELRGLAEVPQLEMLGGVPESWPKLSGQIQDEAIAQRLSELEGALGTALMPENWPGQGRGSARPASPGPMEDDAESGDL